MGFFDAACYVVCIVCFTGCFIGWIGWIVVLKNGMRHQLQNIMREEK